MRKRTLTAEQEAWILAETSRLEAEIARRKAQRAIDRREAFRLVRQALMRALPPKP